MGNNPQKWIVLFDTFMASESWCSKTNQATVPGVLPVRVKSAGVPFCQNVHIPFYLSWIIKNHQTSSNINKHQQKIYQKYQTCYTRICLAMLKFQKPIVPKAGTSNMCRNAKSIRIKFCWNHASSYSPQVANDRTTGTQQLNVQSTDASGLIPNQTPNVPKCHIIIISFIVLSIFCLRAMAKTKSHKPQHTSTT